MKEYHRIDEQSMRFFVKAIAVKTQLLLLSIEDVQTDLLINKKRKEEE